MKHKRVLVVLSVILFAVFLVSCNLNNDYKPGKIWYIGYSANFYNSNYNRLYYTFEDAIELGKAFKALSNKAQTDFEDYYFLGDVKGEPRLTLPEKNYSCDWDTYSAKVKEILKEASDNDIIIYTFSTHGDGILGWNYNYGSVEAAEENDLIFFNPTDKSIERVSYSDLKEFIDGASKGTKAVFFDACFSGSFIVGDGISINKDTYSENPCTILFNKNIRISDNVWALSACTFNQYCSFDWDLNHGAFTYYLLKALGWDEENQCISKINALRNNMLSLGDIASYVYTNGGRCIIDNNEQIPVFSAGSFDLILFRF